MISELVNVRVDDADAVSVRINFKAWMVLNVGNVLEPFPMSPCPEVPALATDCNVPVVVVPEQMTA